MTLQIFGPMHRPLPDNTQHTQETDSRSPDRIRTHGPSKWAAANLRLRPCDNRDRQRKLL